MRGPIDYIIVGFDGLKFDGSIIKAIGDAVDNGIVNLVSMSLISKDAEGAVKVLNLSEIGDEYLIDFVHSHPMQNDLVDQDDIDEVSEILEPNTAAGMLVIEHLWAKPLKKALKESGGYLIAEGRIHPDAVAELNKGEEE